MFCAFLASYMLWYTGNIPITISRFMLYTKYNRILSHWKGRGGAQVTYTAFLSI